jgi:hypothetical protein
MRPVSEAENMRADVRRKVDYRNPRVVAILRFGRIAAFEAIEFTRIRPHLANTDNPTVMKAQLVRLD